MSKVIVALDGVDWPTALDLAVKLKGRVWGYKVNDLLLDQGVQVISILKDYGRVFADPKLFDIPNTVANSVRRLRRAGADLITVHAMGGPSMLKAAVTESPGILAVTVLTSMSDEELGYIHNLTIPRHEVRRSRVSDLAFFAYDCKCKGIVCAAGDLDWVQHYRMLKVVPGIRPDFLEPVRGDDQVHKGAAGDLMVVGRPITQAQDPVRVVELLNERL